MTEPMDTQDDTYVPPDLHDEHDPHCTCPDCIYDHDQRLQAGADADEKQGD